MKAFILLPAVGLLCGCVHSGSAPLTVARIAGSFATHDLLWSRTLQLHPDGSFSFYQLAKDLGNKGDTISFAESWGVSGQWTFVPPDRIDLVSASRSFTATIYVRLDSKGRTELLQVDQLPTILKAWDAPPTQN